MGRSSAEQRRVRNERQVRFGTLAIRDSKPFLIVKVNRLRIPTPDRALVYAATGDDWSEIWKLVASLDRIGQLTPIEVVRVGRVFLVTAGYRRFLAICQLGWHEIAVKVVDVRGRLLERSILAI
jgi:hypothetical protein